MDCSLDSMLENVAKLVCLEHRLIGRCSLAQHCIGPVPVISPCRRVTDEVDDSLSCLLLLSLDGDVIRG